MFRRDFGEHGVNPLSIYMRNYKVCLCLRPGVGVLRLRSFCIDTDVGSCGHARE